MALTGATVVMTLKAKGPKGPQGTRCGRPSAKVAITSDRPSRLDTQDRYRAPVVVG